MGWIFVGVAVLAAYLGRHTSLVFWFSSAMAILGFWSLGVMHNRPDAAASSRHDAAVARMRADGMSDADIRAAGLDKVIITYEDAQLAPNWAATLQAICWVGSVVALIWAGLS